MASRRGTTVTIDLAQLDRVKKKRTKNGRVLTEWYNLGTPRADLWRMEDGVVVRLRLSLPFDVPSKPRTTQNSTWQPSYQNYLNWRSHYRKWVLKALEDASYPVPAGEALILPGQEILSPALALAPLPKTAKLGYIPPILVTGTILTRLRGDADNRIKSVLDASNKLLWPDDRFVAGVAMVVLPCGDADPCCTVDVQVVLGKDRKDLLLAWQEDVADLAKTMMTQGLESLLERPAS